MMDILLKGMDAVTADPENSFVKNADIGIRNGLVEFITPSGNGPKDFKAEKIIDGRHRLVMPGLVNAHTHCSMTLLRNAADDLPLDKWLFKRVFPIEARLTEEDIYWGTMLGIAEMLKTGTTTFTDMYLHMNATAQAVCDSGIRANLSRSPLDYMEGEKHKNVNAFLECREYHRTWHGQNDSRIKVFVEVHSTYLFDLDSLEKSADLASELGTGIQIHILETVKEKEDSLREYGKSPVEICEETGIFKVPVVAAHCVHLSDNDMDIMAARGVYAAHNPTSNLKLGSGIARVPEMLEKGIRVSLGTDGAASNNNLNMFEEMHLAALLHKGIHMNPELVNAEQVVTMATANGAEAAGFGDLTGHIRAGMRADLTILDTDKAHLTPLNDPHSAIVYAAQGSDVDTVLVDGEFLLENGRLTTIDEEKVKHEARRIAARLLGQTHQF